MSSFAMKWSKRQRFADPVLTAVVKQLAQYDENGSSFRSQETIAKHCGLSVRAVRYALKMLEAFGVIKRHRRSKGRLGRTSDVVRLECSKDFDISVHQIRQMRAVLRPSRKLQPAPRAFATGTTCRGTTLSTSLPYQEEGFSKVEGCSATSAQLPHAGDTPDLTNVVPFRLKREEAA